MSSKPTDPDEFIEQELRPRRETIEELAQLEDNPIADRAQQALKLLDQFDEEDDSS